MSDILQELVAAGQRTKSADASFALSHYLEHPHRLHCFIAFDDSGRALGFQSLKLAHDGNPYATPVGWGIIGTHVRPSAARLGVGSGLFAATLSAVRSASLPAIEAYIGKQNHAALAYYESLGFRTYRETDGVICKAFQLLRSSAA
ncbi:MAG TPA: GNAT family N-acetyltransferase [Sphingomicrobium sp.]